MGKIFGRGLGTSGAALVEFAIIVPVAVVLGLGAADYGLLANNTTVLQAGVRNVLVVSIDRHYSAARICLQVY